MLHIRAIMSVSCLAVGLLICAARVSAQPVPIIFDTDIGNDVDDALALGMIHSLQSRGACELLAVTISKDHDECAPFVDAINTFYGRGGIPVGVVRNGVTPAASSFTKLANRKDADTVRYPHDLNRGQDAPGATFLLRKTLAAAEDNSVVIVQVGFSTNLARLLASGPDDLSQLTGLELAKQKVRLLSVMAGAFASIGGKAHYEYNVVKDIPSAQKLARRWPAPIVYSGFEVGLSIPYPAVSIEQDYGYVEHHPLAEAYHLYNPPPHNRPTWDLTSVLYAVYPDRDYFRLSPPGRVSVDEKGLTEFAAEQNGPHRYLIATPAQQVRVTEAQVQLSSQPPDTISAD